MNRPVWSVVIPLFNEVDIVNDLVARCLQAMDELNDASELVLVNDASTDATAERLQDWAARDQRVQPVLLTRNLGQFRATQAGLAAARGQFVVTLDGDLQDPPELIPALAQRLLEARGVDVVFAAKVARQDPAWIRAGARAHELLQRLLSGRPWPGAVGSYAAMPIATARLVQQSPLPHANLSAVLIGARARFAVVQYQRAPRENGNSRVGPFGLVVEALGSLVASGAAWRLALGVSGLLIGVGCLESAMHAHFDNGENWCLAGVVVGFPALVLRRRQRVRAIG